MNRSLTFVLNGEPRSISVDEQRPLLWVLRDDLGLTGAKYGCGEGLCGSCTILVDDAPVRSCATRVGEIAGRRILTIEGLGRDGRLHPLQQAFLEERAYQCGFCTPGMIMSACALLLKTPHPSTGEIIRQMDDNLCRCGSHVRIVKAIRAAAGPARGAGQ